MTDPSESSKFADFGSLATLASVERAAFELRCGRPVFVVDETDQASLILGTEMITDDRLLGLKNVTTNEALHIVLTHQRAKTLKIRLYTQDVVRIPYPEWLSIQQVRHLADPQFDLGEPMRGPFIAERTDLAASVTAGVKLAKISRILPSVIAASVPAVHVGKFPHIIMVTANDVLDYDTESASKLQRVASAKVPLDGAENSRITAFRPADGGVENLAIIIGDPNSEDSTLVRIHSECFTGDLLGSLKCDCGDQLRGAIDHIAEEGNGVLLYLAQEGRGIGLINKLRAYSLQDQGFDTVEANQRLGFEDDERLFLAAAEMLKQLGVSNVRLLSNNPQKVSQLEEHGITVVERVPHTFPSNQHNELYLATKAKKSGHIL